MDQSRINALVEDLRPVTPPRLSAFLLRIAIAFSVSAAFVLLIVQPRPDLSESISTSSFWFKQSILALPLAVGAVLTWRLARPSTVRWSRLSYGLSAAAIAVLAALGLVEMASVRPVEELRRAGTDGLHCLLFAGLASAPMVVLGLRWLKTMAPTHIPAASVALGLLAGGVGTSTYALHCPYESAGYIAVWYGLAVILVTALGRATLPRHLAW